MSIQPGGSGHRRSAGKLDGEAERILAGWAGLPIRWAAAPELIAVLKDPRLACEDSPGNGYAPIHAVDVLGEQQAEAALEPLLELLAECEPIDLIYTSLVEALIRIGPAILEPALHLCSVSESRGLRLGLAEVVLRLDLKGDRILALLLSILDGDCEVAAGFLGQYGDPAALPHLLRAYDQQVVDPRSGRSAGQTLLALKEAITELEGALSPEQETKFRRAMQPQWQWTDSLNQRLMAQQPEVQPVSFRKVGRNEPCPCGSGKKYKRCHDGQAMV